MDEDKANGGLDDVRKAAWCYIALALDKLINTNSQPLPWHSNRQVVVGTFASHDFGMKWSYAEMVSWPCHRRVGVGMGAEGYWRLHRVNWSR